MELKTADVTSPTLDQFGSSSSSNEKEEAVVGFENEEMKILERLVGGKQKHLDVISIVGMAGIGKTTLALKVYNNPTIAYHFDIRAWVSVSQVYQKRDLLLELFSSPHIQPPHNMHKMDDAKLSEALYKCLKGNRYLIIMDDVWNTKAWDDFKRSFPNDKIGSRVMLTSRIRDVALYAKADSIPHDLRFLSKEESWDLLREKVFHNEICPTELVEVGKEIAEKCRGLPLAIVVVAGLLAKKEKTRYWWKEVVESIRSYIASDPHQCIQTLDLSYNHLPDHLKPCFLYFGAFPEDYEIQVTKLTWLWMAEGFIEKSDSEKLEDVAENYLMDLIERSLLLVVKRRSDGRVKSCRIHDLLHDLCLKKLKEENFKFMQPFIRYEEVSSVFKYRSFPYPSQFLLSHLCIPFSFSGNHHSEHSQALFYFGTRFDFQESIISQKFKRLKVLDLVRVVFDSYPTEIQQLQHLRYLAIQARFRTIPTSISNLQNLETLVVKGIAGSIYIQFPLHEMAKLRHMHIDPSNSLLLRLGGSLILGELQTISTPSFDYWNQSYSRSIPNLRKLRFTLFDEYTYPRISGFEFLHKLETLKIFYYGAIRDITLFDLPTSLKTVTLSKFRLGWTEISKLARLPNLEVLKLLHNSFEGKLWDTSSMGCECDLQTFPKLKFLKFESLNIMEWNASKDDFPSLQQLVLNRCRQLKEIPSELFEIPTLEMIELNWCNSTAADSAKEILQEQREMGNEQLKILVYPPNSRFAALEKWRMIVSCY